MRSPSALYPIVNDVHGNASSHSPIDSTHALAIMFKNDVSAVVSGLLLRRGPSTIAWRVIAIIVFAIYLQAFFVAFSHVGNEIIHVQPTLADFYAATAIAWVLLVSWYCATPNHRSPYGEKRLSPSAMRCNAFYLETSAALRFPVSKIINANIARWAAARALYSGKQLPRAIFISKDTNDGATTINITAGYDLRRCFYHFCASPINPTRRIVV